MRALEKAKAINPKDSTAIFLLAMACWQTGNPARARSLFEEADALVTLDRSHDLETIRLRDEAATLLGLSPTRAGNGDAAECHQAKPQDLDLANDFGEPIAVHS